MSEVEFFYGGDIHRFDTDELSEEEPEEQKRIMTAWFLAHYDDPVNVCPYESQEGGYQYIWGGPYNIQDELCNEFSGIVPDDVIEECAADIEREYECDEWSGLPDQGQSDEYLTHAIETSAFRETFEDNLARIRELLHLELPSGLRQHFLRLVYANVVTTLEAYLSDAFIVTVSGDKGLRCKLVNADPNLKGAKVELRELVAGDVTPDKVVLEYLVGVSWHNLARVRQLYISVLGVKWPDKLRTLFDAIMIRHDIVHRNGRTSDGNVRSLSVQDVETLIGAAAGLVNTLDEGIRQIGSNTQK